MEIESLKQFSGISGRAFVPLVLILSLLIFAPFSGKRFSLDSPVSIHVARQIAIDPINPPLGKFGNYLVPWNKTELPQTSVFYATPHPPLLQIYLAPFIAIFGENELLLNWLMFPFYILSVLFFYGCMNILRIPFRKWLTLLFCVAPAVVINSHDIMVDIPLCALTLGSFYFLFRNRKSSDAVMAGLMVALAMLTKITAGTLFLAAGLFYVSLKSWRRLALFLIPVILLYGAWCIQNLLVFGTLQITSNGHMRYIWGDIRYRFERMISYGGGTILFPGFPLILAFIISSWRKPAILIFTATSIWSILLVCHLDYSWSAAAFYSVCSASGLLILIGTIQFFLYNRAQAEFKALLLHTVLQLIGGLFLTLYASRYLTPVLLSLFLGVAYLMKEIPAEKLRRTVFPVLLTAEICLTVFLSIGDIVYSSIPYRLSRDLLAKYDSSLIRYAGRLGYLYYLDHSGMNYCQRGELPSKGELILRNTENSDDEYLLQCISTRATPIDTFTYPLFTFSTVGGRAGFYGHDRLPFALLLGSPESRYILYQISE